MAVVINPIKLDGNWDLGYALDQHVINSVCIGESPFGFPVFDNTYSEIGKLIKQFKYNGQYDNLLEIVSTIKRFLDGHPEMLDFETIIPVPPTRPRAYQPTEEIGEALSKALSKFYIKDVLVKDPGPEAKNLSVEDKTDLNGTIHQKHFAKRKTSVLLLDDIYKSGATLSECVRVLRMDPMIYRIYVITITKTKNSN